MKKLTLVMAFLLFPVLAASAALLDGTVEKVDKGKKQIVLKTEKGQETVEYGEGTVGVEKAKVGAKVTISYDQKGNKRMASEIDASSGSSKTSPSDKPVSPREKKSAPDLK